MSTLATAQVPVVHYPDSDGLPMSDNTIQFNWISILKWNADGYFRNDPNVFVAGDHLIYAVEGEPTIRQAPDVYVVFGRPKHDRGSYKVWEEGGIFPQVIFEVWSPNNRYNAMLKKFEFYEKYGAEEYYIIYPEFPSHAEGWLRKAGKLSGISELNGHISPRLGWRFELRTGDLTIFGPDNRLLRNPAEIIAERDAIEQERNAIEQERDAAREQAIRLAERLRTLGIDPESV